MKFRCDKCNAQYAIADEKVGKKGVRVKCKKCANVITVRPAQEQAAAGAEEAPAAEGGAPAPGPAEGADVPAEANHRENTDVSAPPAATDEGGPKIGDEDLGNAFDNILGESGLPDDGAAADGGGDAGEGDLDRQSTRLFSVEEMQKVQAEKEKATRRDEESRQIGDLYRLARGEEPVATPASPGDSSPGPAQAGEDRLEWYLAVDDQQMGPLSLNDVAERFHRGEIHPDTLAWKSGLGDWAPLLEVAELRFLAQSAAGAEAAAEEPAAPAAREYSREEDEEPAYGSTDNAATESEETHAGGQEYSDTSVTGAAFAADVDWKPSAVSSLSSLAEEELASLRPPEPEPLPEPSDVIPPLMGEKAAPDTAPMDDGDSSINGQIRAEEEAAAREAERKRQEEERLAAEAAAARRKQEEEALAAQEAARREQYQEKKERVVPPPEVSVAPHAAVPRWLIGVLAGGGLLILVLLGFIAYILLRSQVPPEPGQGVPLGPPAAVGTAPAAPPASAKVVPPPAPPSPSPAEGSGGPSAPAAGAESAPPSSGAVTPPPAPPPPEEKPGTPGKKVTPPPPREPKKVAQPAKPPQERDDTLARLQREDKADRGRKERETPPPEEAKPKKKVDKNDILNFRDDDEDDKALQKEMGVKRAEAAPAPKPEEKKELPPRTNADVLEVMKQHLAEFQACSRKQKEVDASVQGRMVIKFVITPEGAVTKLATDTPEFKGTFVSDCIGRVINGIRFPKAGGGPMTVPFPFTVK